MDTEFDFLSYLDFGNGPNQLPVDELSFASSNSDFSTSPFASPHNNVHSDFSVDNHRSISSSPPASSGLSLGFKPASRAPPIAVNDGFSFAGYNINPNLPSSYGHSNGSSNGYNSPPFDTSIYYNLPMQHSQVVDSKPVDISQFPVDADSFQSQVSKCNTSAMANINDAFPEEPFRSMAAAIAAAGPAANADAAETICIPCKQSLQSFLRRSFVSQHEQFQQCRFSCPLRCVEREDSI